MASTPQPFFPRELLAFVARSAGLSPDELISKRKDRLAVRARAVAAVVMRERGASFLRMAKYFQRDHSTLVHAVNTFGEQYANDALAHEMLDYARYEFGIEPEPEEAKPTRAHYGFSHMQVGDVRAFAVKTLKEDRNVRRAAHKLNARGGRYYTTWADRDAGVVNVKRIK